jgi:predicted dehydrogenase
MSEPGSFSRRDFVATTGVALASVAGGLPGLAQAAGTKKRYALVGTGDRGSSMWGAGLLARHPDAIEFVGLCDINPLRAKAAAKLIGVNCPTFTDVDQMLEATRPEILMVTTVCATHSKCIIKGLERGIRVITEKPMVTDEVQCQQVLEAEKRTGNKVTVTFNYRYAQKHRKVKELLAEGAIGKITSVDFSWYLDVYHGADYFRRWHRLGENSGTLFVHKATHHFDLMNWWLDADPVTVYASGDLKKYGARGAFRHTNCRPCPHQGTCPFYLDITRNARYTALYSEAESFDGYQRDGCVFKEDINIYDTMSALVRYSSDVTMAYSVNAFMPFEGLRVAFNGELGRLEMRDYERQPWAQDVDTVIELTRNFGKREVISVPPDESGHGGGDAGLQKVMFGGVEPPSHLRLPDSRAGALACLTGIAARKSVAEKRPIRIADLVKL